MKETHKARSGIQRGAAVLIVLHTPREKCWGVLDEINSAGVFLRGLDLNAFDDWIRAVVHEETFVGLGDLFFPLWRVERLLKDENPRGIPLLCEKVEERAGQSFLELLANLQLLGPNPF